MVAARRTAGEAARAADLALVACGVVPMDGFEPVVTRNDRYQDMVEQFGAIARTGGTCGMHVHVGIDSDEEGVRVIDRLAPWLPVILAISANSPFCEGRDTGYASWRSQVWSRWPSAGPTEPFGSVEGYREVSERLVELGAARDPGMLYYDARLAVEHPTVEIRVSDVCTDPAASVLVAALVRGLVETAATRRRRRRTRGGSRCSGRRSGAPRGTASPSGWCTPSSAPRSRPARWCRRWSTPSAPRSRRPATSTS